MVDGVVPDHREHADDEEHLGEGADHDHADVVDPEAVPRVVGIAGERCAT